MFWIGPLYAWSLFVEPLESLLSQSRASISGVFSIANIGFTLGLLIAPSLYGRLPLGLLSTVTVLIGAGGLLIAGLQMSLWSIWIGYGALFGLANGLGYSLCLQIVHTAFPTRAGFGTGVIVSSYALGSIGWSPVLSWSITAHGPAFTLVGAAAGALAIGGVAHMLLMWSGASLHPRVRRPAGPDEAIAFAPIGVLWLGFLLGSITGMLTIGHASPIVSAQGGDSADVALAVSLVTLGNFLGRFGGGWTSDRLPPQVTTATFQGLASIAIAGALFWQGPGSALGMLFCVGFGYGWMSGAYPVVIAHLFGASAVGRIYGYVNTAWGVAALSAPYVGGAIFDTSGNYVAALCIAGLAAAGAGAILIATQVLTR